MSLCIATSQFPTSADPMANAEHMVRQIEEAAERGADLVHFPEASLSGYAGNDIESYEGYDWITLQHATGKLVDSAKQAGIWAVFGSAHRLSEGHKPHNSLYIVNDGGILVDRYDKRFCAGDISERTGDLAHYTPGNHFCVFAVKGVLLGTLICHEYRYPELYREYGKRGVQVMLHSFHSGNLSDDRFAEMEDAVGQLHHALNPATTIAGITQLAAMPSAASSNFMWISCANSSASRSCWPSFMVRPDGVVTGRLELERQSLLVTRIDVKQEYYDSTSAWRRRAMEGVFHSGSLVDDPRSDVRNEF